jgi:hypothetical protein
LLGFQQYFSPPEAGINAYAWGTEEAISTFGLDDDPSGDHARVTSTFSYISTYAAFLTGAWLLSWIAALNARTRTAFAIAISALVVIAFNMGMNGSRWLLVSGAVAAVPFGLALLRKLGAVRSQVAALCVFAGLAYVGASIFEPFALTAERGGSEEAAERITGAIFTPLATFSQTSFVGSGIGSTFGGFEQLGAQFRAATGFDEVNLDRVGVELGFASYGFMLVLKLYMMGKTVAVWRSTKSTKLRRWLVAVLLVQIAAGWQIPFYNSVAAYIYFAALGLVLRIESPRRAIVAPPLTTGIVATNAWPHRAR